MGQGPGVWRARIGLLVGPLGALVLLLLPAHPDLGEGGQRALALAWLMATWWVTEPVPLAVTSLLPILALPLLGIGTVAEATSPFANPVIFLFLGGFLIAIAVERWRLHERIAFHTALRVGTGPRAIVAGFMVATAFLSMWISNSAAALLMLPMAGSILALVPPEDPRRERFGDALFLGIAYAATIGGLGTLIGTPPNALLAAYSEEFLGRPIGFAEWMVFALPLVVVGLLLTWLLLVGGVFRTDLQTLPGGRAVLRGAVQALGPVGAPEARVGLVFLAVAGLWIARPFIEGIVPLSDAGIAVAGGIALFLIPSGRGGPLLIWSDTVRLPWNVLLLFGGGLSLAGAMQRTGVAEWLGTRLEVLGTAGVIVLVVSVALLVLFLTELTSNTATAAAFLPVAAALAVAVGVAPLELLLPAVLASSCAFMLPVATPPNAVVYGTGAVKIGAMVRAGLFLNLLFVVLITVTVRTIGQWVF